jgi:acetyl-CoA acetyltransferase
MIAGGMENMSQAPYLLPKESGIYLTAMSIWLIGHRVGFVDRVIRNDLL